MLIPENPQQQSIEENLCWLMQPQPQWDSELFDKDGKLFAPVQNYLRLCADVIIEKCIKPFAWLEVEDVILSGLADAYYYHPSSDIELKIIIKTKTQTKVFADDYQIYKFISRYIRLLYKKGRQFFLGNRRIEFSPLLTMDKGQQYSLLYQRWQVPPSGLVESINEEVVLTRVGELQRQIEAVCSGKFERRNGKYALEDLWQMQKFYNRLLALKRKSVEDLLVNKLLSYNGDLNRLRRFYLNQISQSLSI